MTWYEMMYPSTGTAVWFSAVCHVIWTPSESGSRVTDNDVTGPGGSNRQHIIAIN